MAGRHHQRNEHELGQTPGEGEGQGGLHAAVPEVAESYTTGRLNNSNQRQWLIFPSGSGVKNPPVKQETRVQSLDQEDPLEREITTHSIILAWEIPWTEEPGRLQFMRLQKSQVYILATKQQNKTMIIWTSTLQEKYKPQMQATHII